MADYPHVMIVEARFYDDIADELAKGACAALERAGASWKRYPVPGTFEIPAAIRIAVGGQELDEASGHFRPHYGEGFYDGYVALGCVIRGETSHYDHVCQESARGLQDLALRHGLALGYGVLTCENRDQAWARARADGPRDHGGAAARACLAMIELRRTFEISGMRTFEPARWPD